MSDDTEQRQAADGSGEAPTAARIGSIHPLPEAVGEDTRRRGVYLLPNLITSGGLFAGFYAMVASANGNFVAACLAIIAALVLDTADGRVARFTRTESEFGAQYDSLSDMAAFGVAPGLLVYFYTLNSVGQLGWAATFIYMACAALRLARFNTDSNLASFTGLASPAAAMLIACSIWLVSESYPAAATSPMLPAAFAVLTIVVALLMVSPLTYFSPKSLALGRRVPFIVLVAVVVVLALILSEPPLVLLLMFACYALSAPLVYGARALVDALRRNRSES
ncbi:MAG: CDP-diacylglycerol--serine O-phosphatidyltransferase [Pseudomonadota bacterium]